MCIIDQLPTGLDTIGDLSDNALKKIIITVSSLINTGECQLSLVSAPSGAEVDP